VRFADILPHNRVLRYLALQRNGITEHGIERLAQAMEQNTTLRELMVDGPLQPTLCRRLADNAARAPTAPVPDDVALIRSVYRTKEIL
jgi:hypothetical protein